MEPLFAISPQLVKELLFLHGIAGVFISEGAKIGSNCVIFHQVTIGSNTLNDSNGFGSPVIGNQVYIGAGAKIIGNVIIGDNVRIGANAIVTENIESNATVVMSKPRTIIHTNKVNNEFMQFKNTNRNP